MTPNQNLDLIIYSVIFVTRVQVTVKLFEVINSDKEVVAGEETEKF